MNKEYERENININNIEIIGAEDNINKVIKDLEQENILSEIESQKHLQLLEKRDLSDGKKVYVYESQANYIFISMLFKDISLYNPDVFIRIKFKYADFDVCGLIEYKEGKALKDIELTLSEHFGIKVELDINNISVIENDCVIPVILKKQIDPEKFENAYNEYKVNFIINSFALNSVSVFEYAVESSHYLKTGNEIYEIQGSKKALKLLEAQNNPLFINQEITIIKEIKNNFDVIKRIFDYKFLSGDLKNEKGSNKLKV